MEKREYVFLAEKVVSTFLVYRDKDFIESMYLTYKQEDSKPVLEVVLIFNFDGEYLLSRIPMGEFYDPMDKERKGALFRLIMDDSRNYRSKEAGNKSLEALYASSLVVFDKNNLLSRLVEEDSKSTSSTECEKGHVKSIGEIQYGC